MRKYASMLFFLLVFVIPITVFAKSDTAIPFVTEPIQMYGQKSEAKFFYAIEGTAEAGKIHLTTSHSSLLMAPSSVTIAIDDIVVKTMDLSLSDGKPNEIVIPLSKEGLKKGEHIITLKYDGIIKEGVCVDQYTTGNWFTVHLQSYLELEKYEREYAMDLQTFTADFKVLEDEQTSIIIPEEADFATQTAAIRIQAQLTQASAKNKTVAITSNPKGRDKWIVLGQPEQFTNKKVKKLLAAIEVKEVGATFGKIDPSTAYILAQDSSEIEQYVHVLFQADFAKQLAVDHLHISSLPKVNPKSLQTFEELNVAPIIIDSIVPETLKYYGDLPYALPLKGNTEFHLQLQKSTLVEKYVEESQDYQAELNLTVNGMIHAVSFADLVDENTHYTINIPVANELFMQDTSFTFQLSGNGLRNLDPCVTTDQRQWLQIDTKKSSIEFPSPSNEHVVGTFSQLPFPFAFEQTIIVVPSLDAVSNEMYESILTRFRLNNQVTKIVLEDELSEDLRQTNHLLLLNTNLPAIGADKSINPDQLEDAGFISGTEHIVTTIEQNPWNEEKVVLTMEQQDGPLTTTDFVNQLFSAKSAGTIGVYTATGYLSFNTGNEESSDVETETASMNFPMLLAFIALLVVVVLVIFFVMRRRKRKSIE